MKSILQSLIIFSIFVSAAAAADTKILCTETNGGWVREGKVYKWNIVFNTDSGQAYKGVTHVGSKVFTDRTALELTVLPASLEFRESNKAVTTITSVNRSSLEYSKVRTLWTGGKFPSNGTCVIKKIEPEDRLEQNKI